ncbi:4860_t:CDS:1, partial [Entrophospora sp. SA101]
KEISKAKVLYDYEARNSDELNIKVGNIISILDKSLNDWWKAEYEGVKGIIPSNYVEEILNSS